MKRIFMAVAMTAAALTISAQDLQLHYDFGRNIYPDEQAGRPKVTGTFEHFSLDGMGSWYYFVDMDFYNDGACGAYAEVSREFNIGSKGFAAHVEYDGGLCSKKAFATRYQQAALVGGAYNGHNADFSTTYSLQLMYKHYFKGVGGKKAFPSVQLTGVWSTNLVGGALTFAGFFDFWRDVKGTYNPLKNGHGKLVFASEPQLWYNLNSIKGWEKCPVSIGTEMELYSGFYTDTNKMFWNPTLGIKCKL